MVELRLVDSQGKSGGHRGDISRFRRDPRFPSVSARCSTHFLVANNSLSLSFISSYLLFLLLLFL